MVKKVTTKKSNKSTAVAKSESGRTRPSRIGKHVRKLDRLKVANLDPVKAVFTVRVIAEKSPVQLPGVILSMGEGNTIVQHLRSGSSKELVSHIPTSSIVQCVGGVGEKSLVTYLGDVEIDLIKRANVKFDDKTGAYTVRDVDTGDTSMIFARPGIKVLISGDAVDTGSAKPKKKMRD